MSVAIEDATPVKGGRDILNVPVLGGFLRWRHARLTLQLVLGSLALIVVLHGFLGPDLAPKNLATLLTWVHYRGLLVVTLLAVGNLFCMGCPLLLPRELARRFFRPTRRFPRVLRRKWVAVVAFVGVLFAYEAWDLWGDPRWTAALIVAFLGAALAIDASYRGAPFCKYVCPIGQFNFLTSMLSPFEVRAKDSATCAGCSTKDCIRGAREPERRDHVTQRGCELALFLPRKTGNLDCTFCLDCIHACPHDNVAIATRVPGEELMVDSVRSGIGRLTRRLDLGVLVVLFAFGALLNAFGMVPPVYALQREIASALGTDSPALVLGVLFVVSLVVLPAVALSLTAWAALRSFRAQHVMPHLRRMVWSLVPLGVGVWTAHYLFHFLTGLWTFIPVAQSAAADLGHSFLGEPNWGRGGLHARLVQPIELGFLVLGLVGSLAVAAQLARADVGESKARTAFAPWAILHATLFAAAVWLLQQPMEMRGTFL